MTIQPLGPGDQQFDEMYRWAEREALNSFYRHIIEASPQERRTVRQRISAVIAWQDGPSSDRLRILKAVFNYLDAHPAQPRRSRTDVSSYDASRPPMTEKEMKELIQRHLFGDHIRIAEASEETRQRIHDGLRTLFTGSPLSFHQEDPATFERVWNQILLTPAIMPYEPAAGTSLPPQVAPQPLAPQPSSHPPGSASRTSLPVTNIMPMTPKIMEALIRSCFSEGDLQVADHIREAIRVQLEQKMQSGLEKEMFQQVWRDLFAAAATTGDDALPALPPVMPATSNPSSTTGPRADATSDAGIVDRRESAAEAAPAQPSQPPEPDPLIVASSAVPFPLTPQEVPLTSQAAWEQQLRSELRNPKEMDTQQRHKAYARFYSQARQKGPIEIEAFKRAWKEVCSSVDKRAAAPTTAPIAKRVHHGGDDSPNQTGGEK